MFEGMSLLLPSPELNECRILMELQTSPNITQAVLAERLDLSVAMINNYMRVLRSKGHLKYIPKSAKVIRYQVTESGVQQANEIRLNLSFEVALLQRRLNDEGESRHLASKAVGSIGEQNRLL